MTVITVRYNGNNRWKGKEKKQKQKRTIGQCKL